MSPTSPPRTVRRAAQLTGAGAILSAVVAGLGMAAIAHLNRVSTPYLGLLTGVDHRSGISLVTTIRDDLRLQVLVGMAGLLMLAPLSLAVRRPWPKARIAAWLAAALVAVGSILVLAGSPESAMPDDSIDSAAVRAAMADLNSWYPQLSSLALAALLGALVAFTILLARTTSMEFYFQPRADSVEGFSSFLVKRAE